MNYLFCIVFLLFIFDLQFVYSFHLQYTFLQHRLFTKHYSISNINIMKSKLELSNEKLSENYNINSDSLPLHPLRVAYQGEPGAYSEKASKELLGPRILTVNYPSFEDTFRAVANRDADYAVVPIENSLGGSIHANYDLLLRYDLNVIGEYEFRVIHSLLALPGTKKEDIKRVMSHPQALAQCDNYLTTLGVIKESTYDTAGSAKMISENKLVGCGAIASDLAAATYGLEVIESGVEDHDINFTRFLLLGRQSVSGLIPPNLPSKTSIVFVLPDSPGALYKALACFSLREIDCCKIESRPTSVQLLQYLQFKNKLKGAVDDMVPVKSHSANSNNLASTQQDLPRFRYTFYLDFLASEFDDRTQNALHHLREQSSYVRVLGSFPTGGKLLGSIKQTIDSLNNIPSSSTRVIAPSTTTTTNQSPENGPKKLKIGIVGFGKFGQFLAKTFIKTHDIYCMDKDDMSTVAKEIGCDFFPLYDLSSFIKVDVDIILLSVSIISFEEVLRLFPKEIFKGKLVVDVLSVKVHAKNTMLNILPRDCDILCTHPMFGPESGKFGWQGLPYLYEKVRIDNIERFVI